MGTELLQLPNAVKHEPGDPGEGRTLLGDVIQVPFGLWMEESRSRSLASPRHPFIHGTGVNGPAAPSQET